MPSSHQHRSQQMDLSGTCKLCKLVPRALCGMLNFADANQAYQGAAYRPHYATPSVGSSPCTFHQRFTGSLLLHYECIRRITSCPHYVRDGEGWQSSSPREQAQEAAATAVATVPRAFECQHISGRAGSAAAPCRWPCTTASNPRRRSLDSGLRERMSARSFLPSWNPADGLRHRLCSGSRTAGRRLGDPGRESEAK